jgi:hypothetical protein
MLGAVETARAQTACEPGALVGEDGQLNFEHPNAAKVLTALDRFGNRIDLLVPEVVDLRDVRPTLAKVREADGDLVDSLLTLMSPDELGRFAPWLRPLGGDPGAPPTPDPPQWVGPTTIACLLSGSYIEQAQEEMQKFIQ